MNHGDYQVKILNDRGEVIGSKPRKEVDKKTDIIHCADVLIKQNESFVLSRLPAGTLYGGLWGVPTATMVREGEEPLAAAVRSLEKELGVTGQTPDFLGEDFFVYDDGVKRLKTTYQLTVENELRPNPEDIAELVTLSADEIDDEMKTDPSQFAPTFVALWKKYHDQLV